MQGPRDRFHSAEIFCLYIVRIVRFILQPKFVHPCAGLLTCVPVLDLEHGNEATMLIVCLVHFVQVEIPIRLQRAVDRSRITFHFSSKVDLFIAMLVSSGWRRSGEYAGPLQCLRRTFSFIAPIVPRDARLAGFLLYQPIVLALSLGGAFALGLVDYCVQCIAPFRLSPNYCWFERCQPAIFVFRTLCWFPKPGSPDCGNRDREMPRFGITQGNYPLRGFGEPIRPDASYCLRSYTR